MVVSHWTRVMWSKIHIGSEHVFVADLVWVLGLQCFLWSQTHTHPHAQSCALVVPLSGEGRQIVATMMRTFVKICSCCVCGRGHVWQVVWSRSWWGEGCYLLLIAPTDGTKLPGYVFWGPLLVTWSNRNPVLNMFSAALISVALETRLTSNVGLCNLLISGWVCLAEKLLCRQRDCRYFRLWFCSAVNPI